MIERNRTIGTRIEGIRLNEFQAVGGIPVTGTASAAILARNAGHDVELGGGARAELARSVVSTVRLGTGPSCSGRTLCTVAAPH